MFAILDTPCICFRFGINHLNSAAHKLVLLLKLRFVLIPDDEIKPVNFQINGSLLPASVIGLYCTYLCYSGLSSEPRDYECNGLHNHSKAVSTGSLTLGLLTTILSVVYSAVRAGSSATVLSPPDSPRG